MGIQAEVMELPHANLFLLDSGKKGILGERQLGWVAQELDQRPDKPALVFGHYNMTPNRGVRPIRGLLDGPDLLEALTQRKHVRAYFGIRMRAALKKHLHSSVNRRLATIWKDMPMDGRYETF